MSQEKVYVRVVKGPVQIGDKVVARKDYAQTTKLEADGLAAVGYAKIVTDAEGEKGVKAQEATKKPADAKKPGKDEPTDDADAKKQEGDAKK